MGMWHETSEGSGVLCQTLTSQVGRSTSSMSMMIPVCDAYAAKYRLEQLGIGLTGGCHDLRTLLVIKVGYAEAADVVICCWCV